MPAGLFGGSDADFSIRSACFFFADQIHDEFMRRAQAKFGKRWGNEDLPSVDERRKMIVDMEVQRKDLMRKRADLEVQIDEIPGALKS